ncbi:hypothetical protein MB02_14525 [Croceicoccus estronivorus]|nr:hypothetical protein MB02_14525 [Croceicoccus estronivorus]
MLPVFALASLVSLSAPAYAEAPAFSDAGPIASDTGYTLVQWSAPGAVTLDLAHRPDFSDARTLYSGANSAYFLSGLADGTYYLKLRDEAGTASATLELDVAHQSLTRALWLAGLGALVFLAIVATILRGARDE